VERSLGKEEAGFGLREWLIAGPTRLTPMPPAMLLEAEFEVREDMEQRRMVFHLFMFFVVVVVVVVLST
jgi:hypothetical protein